MSYAIIGRPSGWRAPFITGTIDFAQGQLLAPAGAKAALYLCPIPTTGGATAAPYVIYDIESPNDAEDRFLAGTPGCRALKAHMTIHKEGRIKAIGYPESTGAGAAKATMTVTFGGTITPGQLVRFDVLGEIVEMMLVSTDTLTTLAAQFRDKVNALTTSIARDKLPFTAASAAAVATLTSRLNGATQNNAYGVRVLSAPPGLTVTLSAAALSGGADGATTELAGINAALAVLGASTSYYHCLTTTALAAQSAALKTFVVDQSDADNLRTFGIGAIRDTKSAGAAIALAQNYERLQFAWHYASPHDPAEIVAQLCAVRQKYEQLDPRWSFAEYAGNDWMLKPAPEHLWPTPADINSALQDGLSAIGNTKQRTYLSLSVTSRSKDALGTFNDYRAADTHRIVIFDDLLNHLIRVTGARYKGFFLMEDKLNEDGSVDVNQKIPDKHVTPSQLRTFMLGEILSFGPQLGDGRLQKMDEWESNLSIRIDPLNRSRAQIKFGGPTTNLASQFSFKGSETSPG